MKKEVDEIALVGELRIFYVYSLYSVNIFRLYRAKIAIHLAN